MRILFCNKYNFRFSGTEAYLFELMELMRVHGHEVALFSMADPRGVPGQYDQYLVSRVEFKSGKAWWRQAGQLPRIIYSAEARSRIRSMIRDFRPDVAHVRNIYHHLTPSILWELRAQNIPVLYHLNDFKLLCPTYNLVAKGESCERCKSGSFWRAVPASCYPGIGARLALTAEAYAQRCTRVYDKCVDMFLAPSTFVQEKFVEQGWDRSRFKVLPHFQRAHEFKICPPSDAPSILYFGRLSTEKGIHDLLHAMRRLPNIKLIIAGDGPQKSELQRLATSLEVTNLEFVGSVTPGERDRLLRESRFSVFPSHAYETLGKTILESYAEARAVVATDLGSRREFVRDGETGLLYQCGDIDQLVHNIRKLVADTGLAEQLGRRGWEYVRQYHSPEEHYSQLFGLYEELISAKRRSKWKGFDVRERVTYSAALRPLRIAFIGGRGVISKYSGIESYYEEVGKRLAHKGHKITAYCRSYFTPEMAEHNGMSLVRLPTFRSKHLETVLHTLVSTLHACTRSYDVVHYHALGPSLFSFIPRLVGKKTVVTVQGLDWQRRKWGKIASAVLRWGEFASASFPNRTMVVSRTLQRHYREMQNTETTYVPNGGIVRDRVAANSILAWGLEPGRYVLFLGRFSPEKGCDLLIRAFQGIQGGVKLVMAGGTSYSDTYARELLAQAGDRVRMLPWVSGKDLDELLTNAMIFVLPSDMEGLSLALLDAMGAGICVLTSDVPENREAVEGTGFTFHCRDVESLSERLRFLISDPDARAKSGRAVRSRIQEHYDWDKITDEIERVYFDVLRLRTTNTAGGDGQIAEAEPIETLAG